MATISNVKNVDMQQLEFQNLGSAQVQSVLQQPLLKNASTYTSELVSMQISLDGVSLVPEGEEFISIGMRPLAGMLGDIDALRDIIKGGDVLQEWSGDLIPFYFGPVTWVTDDDITNNGADPEGQWQNLVNELESMADDGSGDYDPLTGFWKGRVMLFDLGALDPAGFVYYHPHIVNNSAELRQLVDAVDISPEAAYNFEDVALRGGTSEEAVIRFRHYTTRLDMLEDLQRQVLRVGQILAVRYARRQGAGPIVDAADVDVADALIRLEVTDAGKLELVLKNDLLKDHFVRLGPGFKRLFSKIDWDFVLGVGENLSFNIDDANFPTSDLYNEHGVAEIDVPGLQGHGLTYDLYDQQSIDNDEHRSFRYPRRPDEDYYYASDQYRPNWRRDRYRYFPAYTYDHDRWVMSEQSFGLVEVPRRKLIVEASYPISHTTCWEHSEEKRRIQFQEFKIVPELEVRASMVTDVVGFKEDVYSGAVKFLDNHGTLALKKLFEGQIQALRIDVLEELEDDEDKRTRLPVKMLKNGFMYLKWLFTKETV